MVWTIAKREFFDNVVSFRFAAGSIACIILVVFSTLTGIERYELELESYSSLARQNEEKLQTKVDLGGLQRINLTALRRPSVLSVITRGGSAIQQYAADITPEEVPVHRWTGKRENEYLSDLIEFDVTKAVSVVMSLLALLISFNVISGEKERGLLKLQLSNPVGRGQLFLGKYIGASITLAFPVMLCLGLCLLIISLFFPIPLTFFDYLRLIILFAVYMVFLSVVLLFGLLFSSLAHRSSTSLAFSLMAWLLFVQIVPNGGIFLADRFIYVPPRDSTYETIEKMGDELRAETRKLWESNPQPSMEKRAEIIVYINCMWTKTHSEKRYEIEKEYILKLQRQKKVAEILSGISPVFLVEKVSQALCHTSVEDYERFLERARIYHGEILKFENECFSEEKILELIKVWMERKGEPKGIELNQIQPFLYRELDLGGSLRATFIPVAVLILLNSVLFNLTLAIFMRYDVR